MSQPVEGVAVYAFAAPAVPEPAACLLGAAAVTLAGARRFPRRG
jgi:hypothetical protein